MDFARIMETLDRYGVVLVSVTRARITQIIDLNLLAPDIQAAILELPRTVNGRDAVRERHVRAITGEANWVRQRSMWRHVMRLTVKLSPIASI